MRRVFPPSDPDGTADHGAAPEDDLLDDDALDDDALDDDALDDDALGAAYAPADRSIRLGFVSSVDGAVSVDGRSGGLGTAGDRRILRLLRDLCDVVLVGAGTARTEGYGPPPVTAVRSAWRQARGLSARPRLAVVSSGLDLDPTGPLFEPSGPRTIVVTHGGAPRARRRALEAVADVVEAGAESVDLTAVRDELGRRGLSRILCEGGPGLAGDLIGAGLVDDLCLTLSPLLVGGAAGRILHHEMDRPAGLRLRHVLEEDGAMFLRYDLN